MRGEPGIGKSALLDEAARNASDQGMLVLRAVGHQSEAEMPFAGLHQLIHPISGHITELPTAQQNALAGAFGRSTEPSGLFLVALATLSLLSDAASESPLLLIADDAQWLDSPTCQVLFFVARRLESDPAVLLIAVRDGFGTELDRHGLPEMRVQQLDEDAAATLLDRHAVDLGPGIRRRLLAEAAGNPLALIELPIAWRRRGIDAPLSDLPLTGRLEQAFGGRVDELPALTRTMLLIGALADRASLSGLFRAMELLVAAKPTLADLAPAEAARLIDVDERGLRFRHPLVRSAIVRFHGLAERRAAHDALARALVDQPDRAVWHAAAAAIGPDEAIASRLEATAVDAERRGAASVAVAALRRAAQLSDEPAARGRRLLAAAQSAQELARDDEVAELLTDLDPRGLPPRERSKLLWFREFLLDASGTCSVRAMVDCADRLSESGQAQSALNALLTAAMKCFWTTPDEATRDLVVAAADRLPIAADNAWLLAITALAAPATRGVTAIDLISRITPDELLAGTPDESKAFEAMRLYALALTVASDNERARAFQDASTIGLRRQGRLALLSRALASQVCIGVALGDWRLAEQAGEEGTRLASETGQPRQQGATQLALAAVAAMRGDHLRAEGFVAEAERTLAPFRPRWPFPMIEVIRATIALSAGSYDEAFDRYCRIFDATDVSHHWITSHWTLALMDLADAAVLTRHVETAAAIVSALRGPENSLEFRWGIGYAAALLADADGDPDPAFAPMATSAPSEFAYARLHLAWGMRLRRQRRVADSRRHLRLALEGFNTLGATPWSERAHQELRASGETSRRRVPETLDDLSPQEIQIALLAADGLTNREIGARLFISHRTVGSHLYRIFPKLSVTSRAELRDAMSRFPSGRGEVIPSQ